MPKRKLTKKMGSLYPVSKALKTLLEESDILRKKIVLKKKPLLIPNMEINEVHYMPVGICKAYWIDNEGNEIIFYIYVEDSFVWLPEEFFLNKKSDSYIEAIADCELYTLTKSQMDLIYTEYPEAMIITNMVRSQMKHFKDVHTRILMKKPCDRYTLFYSDLNYLWRLNLCDKDVRSFLGICQKTLTTGKRELFLKDRRKNRE